MKIICPKNKDHKRFSVTAHVTQEWQTDEKGNFESVVNDCMDVTHAPSSESYWECYECGAEAKVIAE